LVFEHQDDQSPMVPLFQAAALAYHDANGVHTDDVTTLNKVARLIAQHTRLFTCGHDEDDYSLVMPAEVDEAAFRLGGAYLEFPDSRPSLGNLAILRRELPQVLDEIRGLVPSVSPKGGRRK
jgi:hypothetical protein